LEQSLQRKSCIQISQRIGSAANPGGRADENRKQRGFRALTAQALAVLVLLWLIERLCLENPVVKDVVAERSASLRSAIPSENR
jgi:hypothetical protein